MTETPEEPSAGTEGNGQDAQLLPGWSSLVIQLILFGVVSVVALIAILRAGEDIHVTPDTGGTRAYRPADFPEIDFDEPLLPAVVEAADADAATAFNVPPAPFQTDGIFPCSDCHADMDVNYERRDMEMFHEEIQVHHGAADRWCFDCHNAEDRDSLRLVSGELVSFQESYRLCGQCHGTIYRDWREGIHGRRRGYWDGAKSYLLCAHCHNPHAPAFQPLEPLPPPVRPSFLAASHLPGGEPADVPPGEEHDE